jgi:hypothetical protein
MLKQHLTYLETPADVFIRRWSWNLSCGTFVSFHEKAVYGPLGKVRSKQESNRRNLIKEYLK